MPDFLTAAFANAPNVDPAHVAARLGAALALGFIVAWIYRRMRPPADVMPSFSTTLVLLSVLIAMVTQVIGDSVARAFSLVGALSIVRFRTVVRDTQDTAYVIFAVVIGMAVGASDLWVAAIGIGVIGFAAYLMRSRQAVSSGPLPIDLPFLLHVRVGLSQNAETLLAPILDLHLKERRLLSVSTARQGLAFDVSYAAELGPHTSAEALVKALNVLDGVLSVEMQRREAVDGT
jgi:hypothetical protein